MVHGIKSILCACVRACVCMCEEWVEEDGRGDSLISLCVCVWEGGGGGGGTWEGDSLISNSTEKSSQYVFLFWSVPNTVLCGIVASPTNGLGFESH